LEANKKNIKNESFLNRKIICLIVPMGELDSDFSWIFGMWYFYIVQPMV